ncbi:hypothetical protein WMY93_023348 [Mugilogobius chulae]|uniref:Uncharacterized protein n=1 Tax=Mugilogobius chulae TaxID=88201 RepID=A0AAW0NDZ0_9GOBI
MGNYRSKLSKAGCLEVSVNSGKKSHNNPEKDHPHKNIKKARRAELNFLPNFPKGETVASLELLRAQLVEEVQKSDKDLILIDKLMQTTFALRRLQIVQENPALREFMEKWPALKIHSQICAEFHRISNVNLRNQFYAELDRQIPELFFLFRKKASNSGKAAETLRNMIEVYDKQQVQDANVKRHYDSAWSSLLPTRRRQRVLQVWNKGQSPEPDLNNTPIGIVTVVNEDPEAAISFGPVSAAIVIEDEILLRRKERDEDMCRDEEKSAATVHHQVCGSLQKVKERLQNVSQEVTPAGAKYNTVELDCMLTQQGPGDRERMNRLGHSDACRVESANCSGSLCAPDTPRPASCLTQM